MPELVLPKLLLGSKLLSCHEFPLQLKLLLQPPICEKVFKASYMWHISVGLFAMGISIILSIIRTYSSSLKVKPKDLVCACYFFE